MKTTDEIVMKGLAKGMEIQKFVFTAIREMAEVESDNKTRIYDGNLLLSALLGAVKASANVSGYCSMVILHSGKNSNEAEEYFKKKIKNHFADCFDKEFLRLKKIREEEKANESD